MTELWYPSPSVPGCEVSSLGRVRRTRLMKQGAVGTGYANVSVGHGAKQYVHRLVAEAFLGPAPNPSAWVNHKNGNKKDNRPENLEWVSPSANLIHGYEAGLRHRKLTDSDVDVIRALKGKMSLSNIARWFGVSKQLIYLLHSGRYRHKSTVP